MTVKQSGETQGEKVTVIVSSQYPRKIFFCCPVSHSISPWFAASFLADFFPPRCPFFFPPSFWLIFLFPVYFLVTFCFFCLCLVLPAKVTVRRSGETPGESDCKAGRENQGEKVTVIASSLRPRKIFYCSPVSHTISPRFLASFFGGNLPVTLHFFLPASFWFFCLFSGFFWLCFAFFVCS